MSAEYVGTKLEESGIESLVHFTAKDRNRNQIESLLHALERESVTNLLIMSGDYQTGGFEGQGMQVFDLDPVHILGFVSELNDGFHYVDSRGQEQEIGPTHFFPGAVVSPFKKLESELLPQYWTLEKKVERGAEFVYTQIGYDARKFHELLQYAAEFDLEVPIVANLFVLDYREARAMNTTKVPGAIVTDDLFEEIQAERNSGDLEETKLERAAEMYAWLKGMGFAGVHVGGHTIDYEDVEYVVERGEELLPEWESLVAEFDYPQEDGFYYYQPDPETGLNADSTTVRTEPASTGLAYRGFDQVHDIAFDPDGAMFEPMRWTAARVDDSPLESPYQWFERIVKTITNDCQECGDCPLADLAYLCPMSQCPKYERNGPCGGSYDGYCEVYPGEMECLYVRAYRRLKADGGVAMARKTLRETYIPTVDWELDQTSAWLNYYLGRDYAGREGQVGPSTSR